MTELFKFLTHFFDQLLLLVNEMSPYLLLGFFIGGILHVFFPYHVIHRYMGGKSARSVVNASLLGVPLPLCSCGVIPTGVSFYNNGASRGATVSFLISTPQTGVDSIMATYSMMGLPFALIRPFVAFATGIAGGLIANRFDTENRADTLKNVKITDNEQGSKIKRMLHYAFVELLQDISKWLIIGLLIAALLAAIIPDGFFTAYMSNEWLSMLVIMLVAIPMYVCATGSIPIAMVLMLKGLSPGAALVFLMAGPATNAATIAVIGKSLGRKTLLVYVGVIAAGAFLFGAIVNQLPREWFTSFTNSAVHQHHSQYGAWFWFQVSCSILLTGLIINGYIQRYFMKPSFVPASELKMPQINVTTIIVNGMDCNHCKNSIERNLGTLQGVEKVSADLATAHVVINGENVDMNKVAETVTQLGYQFGGVVK